MPRRQAHGERPRVLVSTTAPSVTRTQAHRRPAGPPRPVTRTPAVTRTRSRCPGQCQRRVTSGPCDRDNPMIMIPPGIRLSASESESTPASDFGVTRPPQARTPSRTGTPRPTRPGGLGAGPGPVTHWRLGSRRRRPAGDLSAPGPAPTHPSRLRLRLTIRLSAAGPAGGGRCGRCRSDWARLCRRL
jgi:hypothetical protein